MSSRVSAPMPAADPPKPRRVASLFANSLEASDRSTGEASVVPPPRSPQAERRRLDMLAGTQQVLSAERERVEKRINKLADYLSIADGVATALDQLSEDMFGRIVRVLEENLTRALQEVLEQPITLKVVRDFKRGTATIRFHVERGGEPEDIMRGQGGSVANILSVGLRMFALATLPAEEHRRFLVLDEQDCWLRPDLVPHLVKIVHDAGRELGFQVLMISHHDVTAFERYADKIYQFIPEPDGVRVIACREPPPTTDANE